MTRDPIWDAMKALSKEKFDSDREAFLQEALEKDDGGWTKHSPHHWTRDLCGHRLQYWPSRNKFHYRGKTRRGDVYKFMGSTECT